MTEPSQCDLILNRLRSGQEWSTWQLMDASGSLAVHSRIHELRDRGFEIEHRRSTRIGADGRKRMVSVYLLVQKAAA